MKKFNNRYFCKNIHRYFTDISDIFVKSNYRYIRVYRFFDPCVQVATHLKGLADKAKLNEKHVKIARIYKAKAASLTSERSELQERAQRMTEEVERLKSDLKHTMSARARAESREDEV